MNTVKSQAYSAAKEIMETAGLKKGQYYIQDLLDFKVPEKCNQ